MPIAGLAPYNKAKHWNHLLGEWAAIILHTHENKILSFDEFPLHIISALQKNHF